MWRVAVVAGLILGCSRAPGPSVSNARESGAPTADAAPAETAAERKARCYPYQPRGDGTCPTECATREDCQGSRGPADFAENGWPLDCIQRKCVPLPPERVRGR